MTKLTPIQRAALERIERDPSSAYSLHVTMRTIHVLHNEGFINPIGRGHIFSARTGLWKITATGKAFLSGEGP